MTSQNRVMRAVEVIVVSWVFVASVAAQAVRDYDYDSERNRVGGTQQVVFSVADAFRIEPQYAAVGQRINIYGRNFPVGDVANTDVTFGGLPGNVLFVAERVITVEVPTGATTGSVLLTLPDLSQYQLGTFSLQGIDISPVDVEVLYDGTVQFLATVTGAPTQAVEWRVDGVDGGSRPSGTITPGGLYTAPSLMNAGSGPYLVSARSVDLGLEAFSLVKLGCTSTTALAYGQSATGSISANDRSCHDWMGTAGDLVWISTAGSDLIWELFRPDGVPMLSWTGVDRQEEILLPQSGSYRIVVRSNGGNSGSFTLGLSDQPVEPPQRLSSNASIAADLSPYGDVDEYTFTGTVDQVVTFYADTASSTDVQLRLLDSSRMLVDEGVPLTGGDPDDSALEDFVLPATDTYIVQVFVEVPQVTGTPSYAVQVDEVGFEVLPIAYGQSVVDAIDFAGDIVCYEWSATAGDLTWLSVTGATHEYELFAPDGTSLFAQTTSDFRLEELVLGQTGTYRLFIRSDGGSKGNFTLGLSDQPIEAPIALGLNSRSSADLSPYGDVDEYTFSGTAGQVVTFYADTGSTTDVQLRLLDSSRMLVAAGAPLFGGDSDDSALEDFVLPATDTFIVQVFTEFSTQTGTPSYTVQVDEAGFEVLPIAYGQSVVDAIDFAGDIVCYEWSATAGDLTWLSVTGATHEYELFAPDGTSLFADTTNTFRLEELVLGQTGTYRLFIRSDGGSKGNFTLGLSDQPIEAPIALGLNSRISADVSPYGDVDEYTFSGTAGQVVTFYVDTASSWDVQLRLLDSSRMLVDEGVPLTGGDPDDSALEDFVLPATDTYIVQVFVEVPQVTGTPSYTVQVDEVGFEVLPIAYGQSVVDAIDFAGDIVCYEWSATAGDLTWLSVTGATHEYELFAPDGTSLFADTTNTFRLEELVLGQTGTYRLFVRSDVGSTGNFTLGLSDQPIESLPRLATGVPVNDQLSPFGDVDEWSFNGASGQVVDLLADTTSGADLKIRLLDSQRNVLVEGVNGSDPDDSEISAFSLRSNDAYTVQVFTEFITTSTPSYTLTLQ